MKLRSITSLTLLISLVLVILTSLIMFIVPQGRVAYWSDWRLWGLSKTQWSELHLNLGLLMLLSSLLHIYYNWKPILNYLKSNAKKLTVWNGSFGIALLISSLVAAGTYFQVPPLHSIITLSESIKDAAAISYGEPPYGHAELSSLKMFARKQDLDLAKSLRLLEASGFAVEGSNQTIVEVARQNQVTPKQVYEVIKPARIRPAADTKKSFPLLPPPGFGTRTLTEICNDYECQTRNILKYLAARHIQAEADERLKDVAAINDLQPMAVFEAIRAAVLDPN